MIRLIILRLTESYFRHRWLYTLPLLLSLVAGGAYLALVPAPYVARGTLYIQEGTLLSSLTSLERDGFRYVTPANAIASEIRELLKSRAFMRAIIRQTDLEEHMTEGPKVFDQTIEEAVKSLWVLPVGDNLVTMGSIHKEPLIAYQLNKAATDTFIQWKINVDRKESQAAQAFFLDLIETYEQELIPAREALTAYLLAHPDPQERNQQRPYAESIEIARLEADVDMATERLRRAEEQEENARLAQTQSESEINQTYVLLDAPEIPLEPDRSNREMALTLVIFGALGAVMTVIGIVGGALMDRTFRFPADVKYRLHLPILAQVPESKLEMPIPSYSPPIQDDSLAQATKAISESDSTDEHASVPPISVKVGSNGVPSNGTPKLTKVNNQRRVFGQKRTHG